MTAKRKRLTQFVVWPGVIVLAISGFATKERLVESYWLSRLASEEEEDRKVAAEKLAEMKSVRAVPSLDQEMVRSAEILLPQMENMRVRSGLTRKLRLSGGRERMSDALRVLGKVAGMNFVAARGFPEEGEVSLPSGLDTVDGALERLLEQLEVDGVYFVHDGAVISRWQRRTGTWHCPFRRAGL